MDRNIVYPGSIPLDTDVLTVQRNVMTALGFLAQATLGTSTVVDGLACTQQTVPDMTFNVGPGSILSLQNIDATTFGSLASGAAPLVKMGINTTPTVFTTVAPGTVGQSRNYLIQAAFQEADATSVVLPYYNSSNPSVAYSGPANSGTPQNTQRLQTVNLTMKTGTAATTGSQVTPTPDGGFVGLWVVTVANGQTSVVTGNIKGYPGAPFIPNKLPQVRGNGFRAFTTSTTWLCPPGVTQVESEVWGGGGAGGGVVGTAQSSGGSGAGYSKKICTTVPGTLYTITIGAGGTGGAITGGDGTAGGTSSFDSFHSATGGGFGHGSTSGGVSTVGSPGAGSGGDLNLSGSSGSGGAANTNGGSGGGAPRGIQGAPSGSVGGTGGPGQVPGAGGAGTATTSTGQLGGAGGGGMITLSW